MNAAALLLGVDEQAAGGGPATVSSLSFDGSTGYVDCGPDSAAQVQANQALSISVWLKPSGSSTDIDPLTLANPSSAAGWYCRWNRGGNARLEIFIFDGSSFIAFGTPDAAVPAGSWTHVVLTYDGSGSAAGGTVYVNGVSVTPTTLNLGCSTISYAAAHCNHGRRDDGSEYFNGQVCQPAIWGTVLSPTQVTSLYNGTDPTTVGSPINAWKYTEGTGTTVADSAGTATGTLSGGVTWSTDIPANL